MSDFILLINVFIIKLMLVRFLRYIYLWEIYFMFAYITSTLIKKTDNLFWVYQIPLCNINFVFINSKYIGDINMHLINICSLILLTFLLIWLLKGLLSLSIAFYSYMCLLIMDTSFLLDYYLERLGDTPLILNIIWVS